MTTHAPRPRLRFTGRLRFIGSGVYAYRNTEYRVEMMGNGLWDAYLPDSAVVDFIPTARKWESCCHQTRESAVRAISTRIAAERRAAIAKAEDRA